jgi:GT2 family glycosyltransferase
MIDLSITLVSCDNIQQLSECLTSIIDSSPLDLSIEVVAVDNASTGEWSVVREKFPTVRVVRSEVPVGYAAAHNMALGFTSGRYALIMNDDMSVKSGALLRVVRYMDEHSSVGALGCKLANADGSLQITSFLSYPSLGSQVRESFLLHLLLQHLPFANSHLTMYGRTNTDSQRPRSVKHLMGAFIAVRRAVLEMVGPLDPEYFFSFEDIDWCWRIRQAGWDIAYVPNAVVVHYGSQTLRRRPDRLLPSFYAGRARFGSKHGGLCAQRTLQIVILIELLNKSMLHAAAAWLTRGGSQASRHKRQSELASAYRMTLVQRVRSLRGESEPPQ